MSHEFGGKVLVLGGDDRVTLAVTRSLGRRGIEVHLAWCDRRSVARASRYATAWHDLAPYKPDDWTWCSQLHELVARERFDAVFPCNDAAVVPLQLHRERFEAGSKYYLLNRQAFAATFDKFETVRLAQTVGVSIPASLEVFGGSAAAPIVAKLGLPVYLKPRSSVTAQDVLIKRSVTMATSLDELQSQLDEVSTGEAVLAQAYFAGRGIGVEILANQGQVLLGFQHLRLHETIDGGSTYRQSMPVDSALLSAVQLMIAKLDYTGVAMVEFRQNQRTRAWVLLEINGRFWGSLPLAIAAGADYPWYLYQLMVHGHRDFMPHWTPGIRCRNLISDFRHYKGRLGREGITWSCGRELASSIWRTVTFQDCFDTMVRDDLWPGIVELRQWVGGFVIRLLKKLKKGSIE